MSPIIATCGRVVLATALAAAALVPAAAVAGGPTRPDESATHRVGAATLESTAVVRPDDRAAHGVGAVTSAGSAVTTSGGRTTLSSRDDWAPSALGATVASESTVALRPDDRGQPRGPGAFASSILAPEQVGLVETGFDWIDAAIGAFGGLGIALLLGGAVLVSGRRPGAKVALH